MAYSRRPRRKRRLFHLFLLLSLLLGLYMALSARVVYLETCDVYLKDLPVAFEGTTILLVTDPHVGMTASGEKTADLINSLQPLYPDLLLLGGDYAKFSPIFFQKEEDPLKERRRFFEELRWFYAPLGKFAVRGNHDRDLFLTEDLSKGGISLLTDQVVRLEKEGQSLFLAGLDDWGTGSQSIFPVASLVREQDAVIVLTHNPAAFPMALREGDWFDLMVCGHTHGGQIRLPLLSSFFSPVAQNEQYLSGWQTERQSLLLVSNGLGTSLLPLRLNAPPQIHFLTLHHK